MSHLEDNAFMNNEAKDWFDIRETNIRCSEMPLLDHKNKYCKKLQIKIKHCRILSTQKGPFGLNLPCFTLKFERFTNTYKNTFSLHKQGSGQNQFTQEKCANCKES